MCDCEVPMKFECCGCKIQYCAACYITKMLPIHKELICRRCTAILLQKQPNINLNLWPNFDVYRWLNNKMNSRKMMHSLYKIVYCVDEEV